MKPSESSILVLDCGQFFSLAQTLAPHFNRCYFGSINSPAYPTPNARMIGDGFDGIEHVEDPFSVMGKVQAIVIPDVGLSALQKFLINQSFPVWGSCDGDALETDRGELKRWQESVGLPVPEYKKVYGIPNLRHFLEERNGKECFIKFSLYRGLGETRPFTGMEEIQGWLDHMAIQLGPMKLVFEFIVEEPIETKIETGIDAPFCGRWPVRVQHAVEAKDKGCIATVTDFAELPQPVKEIAEKLKGYLIESGYFNFASFEARIREDGIGIMNDFTARMATPCGETMIRNIGNLPEVVLAGAHGEFVEPEWTEAFSAQALIDCSESEDQWRVVRIPKEAQPHVCLYCPIQIDDELFAFPPLPYSTETIGSIVTKGGTIKGCVEQIKEVAEMLPNLSVKMEGIQAALAEVIEMEEKDVPFTEAAIPKPETAVT